MTSRVHAWYTIASLDYPQEPFFSWEEESVKWSLIYSPLSWYTTSFQFYNSNGWHRILLDVFQANKRNEFLSFRFIVCHLLTSSVLSSFLVRTLSKALPTQPNQTNHPSSLHISICSDCSVQLIHSMFTDRPRKEV